MKPKSPLRSLAWCVLGALALAFLFAPALKVIVERWLYAEVPEYDFSRVYRRMVQIFALILLLFHWRSLEVGRRVAAGFRPARSGMRDLFGGIAVAVLIVLGFQAISLLEGSLMRGERVLDSGDYGKLVWIATWSSLSEEILFSAIFLAILAEAQGAKLAILWRGLFFAFVHLLRTDFDIGVSKYDGTALDAPFGFDPWIGIAGAWNATRPLRESGWHLELGEMVGLFLFSTLLAVAYLRTRKLYLPIGLHWGFVFALRLDWTQTARHPSEWLVNRSAMYGSPAVCVILIALTWAIARWPRRPGDGGEATGSRFEPQLERSTPGNEKAVQA